MKTLRVCLAGALMFLLCAGCFGNCVTDFSDSLSCMWGSCDRSRYYAPLTEVDPAPEPMGLGDGGTGDAEVWPPLLDAGSPLP